MLLGSFKDASVRLHPNFGDFQISNLDFAPSKTSSKVGNYLASLVRIIAKILTYVYVLSLSNVTFFQKMQHCSKKCQNYTVWKFTVDVLILFVGTKVVNTCYQDLMTIGKSNLLF